MGTLRGQRGDSKRSNPGIKAKASALTGIAPQGCGGIAQTDWRTFAGGKRPKVESPILQIFRKRLGAESPILQKCRKSASFGVKNE